MDSIGKLDKIVILQSPSVSNNLGQVVVSYATVATVWAQIYSQRGDEAFQQARINSSDVIRVRIRHRDDVQTDWRLLWDGRNYGITAVDRSEVRRGHLWLTGKAMTVK